MCMKISKKDVLRINKGFGGNLRNSSSLDFAIDSINDQKWGIYKKLAYLWRAILVDHPFSDGNKRTAVFFAYAFAKEHQKNVDSDMLVYQAISIAKKNLTNIRQIEWRIKNAIK